MNGGGGSLLGILVLAAAGLSVGINIFLAVVVCKTRKEIRRLRDQAKDHLERAREVAERYSRIREALTKVARRREGIPSNPTVGGP